MLSHQRITSRPLLDSSGRPAHPLEGGYPLAGDPPASWRIESRTDSDQAAQQAADAPEQALEQAEHAGDQAGYGE
jgi:hypothetical protein